jgi:protein-tyrosine-phosphatase
MAEVILQHMLSKAGRSDIEVFSRGIMASDGNPITQSAQEALEEIGLDGSNHEAALLTARDVKRADLILVMESLQRDYIEDRFPEALPKTFLLKEYAGVSEGENPEIPDPYGGSPEDYRKCRMDIQDSLLGVLSKLQDF